MRIRFASVLWAILASTAATAPTFADQWIDSTVASTKGRLFSVNRYTDNPDAFLDRKIYKQFNAIGQLESVRLISNGHGQVGNETGTAFLVSPCYILSNHHVAFGGDYPKQPRTIQERQEIGERYKSRFKVSVGVHFPFAVGTPAVPVRWGDRNGSNRDDWALLRLSSCLGERTEVGWMELNVNLISTGLKGSRVALLSYPSDRGSITTGDKGQMLTLSWGIIRAYNKDNNTIAFDASGAPGSSGGPVMNIDETGMARVIGMYRGGLREAEDLEEYSFFQFSSENANEFLNIGDVIEHQDVRAILLADLERFGKSNPNFASLQQGIPPLRQLPLF